MTLSASTSSASPIVDTTSPSTSTSARIASLAVTTVPFLISVFICPDPLRQQLRQLAVRLRAAVAHELPGVAHLPDHVKVEVVDEHLVLELGRLRDDPAARVAEVAGAVEARLAERRLHPDPVDRADPEAVGDRVRRLLQFPEIT